MCKLVDPGACVTEYADGYADILVHYTGDPASQPQCVVVLITPVVSLSAASIETPATGGGTSISDGFGDPMVRRDNWVDESTGTHCVILAVDESGDARFRVYMHSEGGACVPEGGFGTSVCENHSVAVEVVTSCP